MSERRPQREEMHLYAIALGSNRRHRRYGRPESVVESAIARLDADFSLFDASPILLNPAFGGAGRNFANAVALVESGLAPGEMLGALKKIEREFGRRRGRRWSSRVLDLDIILWSGGGWAQQDLSIPHPEFRARLFVLEPLAGLVPEWRDPFTGASILQLLHRLRSRRPVNRLSRESENRLSRFQHRP